MMVDYQYDGVKIKMTDKDLDIAGRLCKVGRKPGFKWGIFNGC